MKMSQAEIREEAQRLRTKRKDLLNDAEDVLADIRKLFRRCDHPNLYNYTAMGDPGVKCPDCGYQT